MKPLRKIIVFDVDGTLLHRTFDKINETNHYAKINNRFIYLRPHLNILCQYIKTHEHEFTALLWSRMMAHNAQKTLHLLNTYGFQFPKIYDQDYCSGEQKSKKDLRIIAEIQKIPEDNIVLVDDSPDKSVEGQNYINIESYQGNNDQDNGLLELIFKLDKFVNCQKNCLSKKLKNMASNENYLQNQEQEKSEKDKNLKVIVFDVNKTLLIKRKEPHEILQANGKISGEHVYLRPYLQFINILREQHENVKVIVWTTMQGTKRANQYLSLFHQYNLKVDDILHQKHCTSQKNKDLRVVCEKYGCELQNVLLIDDSPYKQVDNQNFMKIQPYKGVQGDMQIYKIVSQIDQFIKCENNCFVKKMMQKQKLKEMQEFGLYKLNKKVVKQEVKKQHKNEKKADFTIRNYTNKKDIIRDVVFGINEVLLYRSQNKLNIDECGKFKRYFIYMRPNLQKLCQFVKLHKIQVYLWTNITKKNSQYLCQILKEKGLPIKKLYTQQDIVNKKKNMKIVAQEEGKQINQLLLVDDNKYCRAQQQNLIQMCPFNAENLGNNGIQDLIRQLDIMVGCNGKCK